MEGGHVAVVRHLLQAEGLVEHRADPFGGVDGAGLEGGEDLGRRGQDRIDAELAHGLAAQAGDAEIEAGQIVEALDRLLEPAGGLDGRIAGIERHQIALGIELVPQLLTAAIANPARGLDLRSCRRARQ